MKRNKTGMQRPVSSVMIFLLALLMAVVMTLPSAWGSCCPVTGRSVATSQEAVHSHVPTHHLCKRTLLAAAMPAARSGEVQTSLRLGHVALTTLSPLRALILLPGPIMLSLRQRPPPMLPPVLPVLSSLARVPRRLLDVSLFHQLLLTAC